MDGQWEIINNTLARIHSIREREETIATNHSVFPERALKADLDRCLFKKIGHVANGLGRKKKFEKKRKNELFFLKNKKF